MSNIKPSKKVTKEKQIDFKKGDVYDVKGAKYTIVDVANDYVTVLLNNVEKKLRKILFGGKYAAIKHGDILFTSHGRYPSLDDEMGAHVKK